MKWKKTSLSAAMVAVLGVSLVACSSGVTKSDAAAGKPVDITFAAATFAETGRGPLLKAWVEKFNKSQTAVHVDPVVVPQPTFASTMFTQLGGGQGPDLIRFDASDFAQAASSNLLSPLNKVIDPSKYNFIKGPDKTNFVDGKRYGVMFEVSNYALVYNTDLIKTPPKTFEEYVADAKAATKNGVYGAAMRTTLPEQVGMFVDVMNYVYGFGGAWSDGHKLTLNSPNTIKGVEAYKEVYDANVIPKGAPAATYRTMYGQGKVAMVIDNGGIVPQFQGMNPNLHFSAAPIPFPDKTFGGIQATVSVNAQSKHQAAADAFLKWMLEPENQTSLQQLLGASSVATQTTRPPADLKKTPFLSVFDNLSNNNVPEQVDGFASQTPAIRQIVVEQIISALQGKETVQQAMDQAQKLATAATGS